MIFSPVSSDGMELRGSGLLFYLHLSAGHRQIGRISHHASEFSFAGLGIKGSGSSNQKKRQVAQACPCNAYSTE